MVSMVVTKMISKSRVIINLCDEDEAKEYVANINREEPGNLGNAPLCMIKNTVNTIAVRVVLSNGEKSDIKYYNIYPSWIDMPENPEIIFINTEHSDGELIEPDGTTVIKAGEYELKVDNIQEWLPEYWNLIQ